MTRPREASQSFIVVPAQAWRGVWEDISFGGKRKKGVCGSRNLDLCRIISRANLFTYLYKKHFTYECNTTTLS